MRDVGLIDGFVARASGSTAGIVFSGGDCPARDRLIVRLFMVGLDTTALRPPMWQATRAMLARIWQADTAGPAVAAAAALETAPVEARLEKASLAMPLRQWTGIVRQVAISGQSTARRGASPPS